MKYEIITDNEDLLVLTVNSRVISVSHRLSTILDAIEQDYTAYMDKKAARKEKSTFSAQELPQVEHIEESNNSLPKLFGL